MNYYQATNTGKGFITHEDSASSPIQQFPGGVWGTDNTAWAERVGATLVSLEDAQAIVDAALQASYDAAVEAYKPEYTQEQQRELDRIKRDNQKAERRGEELKEVPTFEPLNEEPVLEEITLS